jgi:Asp-tRNA(Asn)/Glu-tRNA(Gln) amidotransferase A subunit family amidase
MNTRSRRPRAPHPQEQSAGPGGSAGGAGVLVQGSE